MISPGDLLTEARDLASGGHGREVHRRAAISRAYYAAFHQARTVAEAAGYRFVRGAGRGMHAHLIDHFEVAPDARLRGMGRLLRNLKRLREDADYRLDRTVAERDVRNALVIAAQLMASLGSAG